MKLGSFTLAIGLLVLVGISMVVYAGWKKYEKSAHTCVISRVDGNTYCVRDRKRVTEAADKLARVASQCGKLIEYMDANGLSPELTGRLKRKFKPDIFMETLPTSQYEAYSENKGASLALCLNKSKGVKSEDPHLIDEHTLMYVAIHELGHICTVSVGHEQEFWDNFRTLLGYAKEAGIHHPVDYSKNEQSYCGITLTDNHYFS